MSDNTVCGYKNYATFTVALQWDNERYLYDIQKELLQCAIIAASEGYNPIEHLSMLIERGTYAYFYRYFHGDNFSTDDLNNVDWIEVAESMLADWILYEGDNAAIGLSE